MTKPKPKIRLGDINCEDVKALITADGEIHVLDPRTHTVLPQAKEAQRLDADEILDLMKEGEILNGKHNHGCGKHFYAAERILEEYLFFTMSFEAGQRENNKIKNSRAKLQKEFTVPQQYIAYDQTDLHNINYMVLKSRSATRKMAKYFSREDNFERAAAAARLAEAGVIALKESGVEEWRLEAEIIECYYFTPENQSLTDEAIMEFLGYKKDRFYRLKNAGISHIARFMFGSFPYERGYLDDETKDQIELLAEYYERESETKTAAEPVDDVDETK